MSEKSSNFARIELRAVAAACVLCAKLNETLFLHIRCVSCQFTTGRSNARLRTDKRQSGNGGSAADNRRTESWARYGSRNRQRGIQVSRPTAYPKHLSGRSTG